MYKIKQNEDKSGWNLVETATDQIIASAEQSHDPAFRELYTKLRGGSGFRGWTPAFFLYKIDPKLIKISDNI